MPDTERKTDLLKLRCTPRLVQIVKTAAAHDTDCDSTSEWIRRTLRREAEVQKRVFRELDNTKIAA